MSEKISSSPGGKDTRAALLALMAIASVSLVGCDKAEGEDVQAKKPEGKDPSGQVVKKNIAEGVQNVVDGNDGGKKPLTLDEIMQGELTVDNILEKDRLGEIFTERVIKEGLELLDKDDYDPEIWKEIVDRYGWILKWEKAAIKLERQDPDYKNNPKVKPYLKKYRIKKVGLQAQIMYGRGKKTYEEYMELRLKASNLGDVAMFDPSRNR